MKTPQNPIQLFLEPESGGKTGGENPTLLSGQNTPPATPQNTAWNWASEDGKLSDGWLKKLGPDYETNPSLSVIQTIPDLVKSYAETKKLVGAKLSMPGEGATPEQVAAWRKTVGAPDKAENYLSGEVKSFRPDSVPENLWNADAEKKFLAVAHKHHLPPAAVKEILGFYGESIAAELGASQAASEAMLKAEGDKLRGAWGAKFDENMAAAARVAKIAGIETTHPAFTDSTVVQAFAKMAALFGEDKLVQGGESKGISGGIQSRISDITDPSSTSQLAKAYRGELGPEQQAQAQATLHGLYQAKG